MCGRYSQTVDVSKLIERFQIKAPSFSIPPRFNIGPTQNAPVIVRDPEKNLQLFKWGLIPSWAKDPAIGNRMINARIETVREKPGFKRIVNKKRCLVIADGFYEWRREPGGKGKTPMRVQLKTKEPFAIAGLWGSWKDPEGEEVKTFTIVTTNANELLKPVHERMPVLLPRHQEDLWLDPDLDPAEVLRFLVPFPENQLEFYPVSKLVNSPENDLPECTFPA